MVPDDMDVEAMLSVFIVLPLNTCAPVVEVNLSVPAFTTKLPEIVTVFVAVDSSATFRSDNNVNVGFELANKVTIPHSMPSVSNVELP